MMSSPTETFEFLKQLYNLPTLLHNEVVDDDFFQYVKQRHSFLVIAAFDEEGRILILRDFARRGGWELLGGSINDENFHDISEAAQLIASKNLGVTLYDIQPIASLINNFSNNSETITHYGLVVIGRINGHVRAKSDFDWGLFKKLPSSMFTSNKSAAELAIKIISNQKYSPALEEVTSSSELSWQHHFHKKFVHPLLGRRSSLQIKEVLLSHLHPPFTSILDASCGDDSFVLTLSAKFKPKVVVCNDISHKSISFLKKILKKNKFSSSYIFTTHDLLGLPFKFSFDLAIFKNTLHHLKSDQDILTLLTSLKAIAKEIIIVDIEDPTNSTFLAWLWNRYYVWFLKDQGHHFVSRSRLKKMIDAVFPHSSNHIHTIKTVKGNYLFVHIGKESSKNP